MKEAYNIMDNFIYTSFPSQIETSKALYDPVHCYVTFTIHNNVGLIIFKAKWLKTHVKSYK